MNPETLKSKLDAQREAVRGKTFAEAPDLFKQQHYEKTREAWHAKRRVRAHA